jgi:hypothetical protein
MNAALLDNLVVFFALVFYAFLFVVYFLRARKLSKFEFKLRIAFSVQLIPFASLWILNFLVGNDSERLIAGLPIIIYLVYDLWYRLLTRKKPLHHPKHWSPALIIYLLLLFTGSIGLNWYGYLTSRFYGNMLVIAFFIMMSAYGYYQYSYNKKRH